MPKSNKPMEMSPLEIEKRVWKVINGNFTHIIHKLDPLPIMRHLKESEILLDDYYEELWNKLEVGKTRANVNERLLGMLEKKERWWHPFIEALRFSGANDTADMIEEALPSSEGSELPESRIRRRDDQKAIVGRPESAAVVDEPKITETYFPSDCEGIETSGDDHKDSTWRSTDDRILSSQQKKLLESGEAAQGQMGILEIVEKYTLNTFKDNIKENLSKPEKQAKHIYGLTGKEKAVVKEENEKNTEDDCKIHHPPETYENQVAINQDGNGPISNTQGNNVPDFMAHLENPAGVLSSNSECQTEVKTSPWLSSPGRSNGQTPSQASNQQGRQNGILNELINIIYSRQ